MRCPHSLRARRASPHSPRMDTSAVSALFVDERDRDTPGVAIPGAEVHLAVRFGPATARGLDVHAVGGRQRVGRKLLRRGQRLAMARLQRGAVEAVFGVPAAALLGRVVPIEQLWSAAETRRLYDRLGDVRARPLRAPSLESEIAGRLALAGGASAHAQLALAAADRLASASVQLRRRRPRRERAPSPPRLPRDRRREPEGVRQADPLPPRARCRPRAGVDRVPAPAGQVSPPTRGTTTRRISSPSFTPSLAPLRARSSTSCGQHHASAGDLTELERRSIVAVERCSKELG